MAKKCCKCSVATTYCYLVLNVNNVFCIDCYNANLAERRELVNSMQDFPDKEPYYQYASVSAYLRVQTNWMLTPLGIYEH